MRKVAGLLPLFMACAHPPGGLQPPAPHKSPAASALLPRPVESASYASASSRNAAEQLRDCNRLAGDPRKWHVHAPLPGVSLALDRRFARCRWTVASRSGALHAEAFFSRRPSVTLPFQPSIEPRVRLGSSDDNPRDVALPPLEVADYLQLHASYLVAYDSGEWGGGLLAFDANGTYRETLTSDNTLRLQRTPSGVLALTGLAHGGDDFGRVLFLQRVGTRWLTQAAELPGSPVLVTPDTDGSLLVVTSNDLLRVSEGPVIQPLHRGHWASLLPNSLLKTADGAYYLGCAHVVVRLRPTTSGFDEEWLAP